MFLLIVINILFSVSYFRYVIVELKPRGDLVLKIDLKTSFKIFRVVYWQG